MDSSRDLTLVTIAEYVKKGTTFTGVVPAVAFSVGAIGALGGVSQALLDLSFHSAPDATRTLLLWLGVLLVAGTAYSYGTWRVYSRRGGYQFTAPARFAYGMALSGMAAGGVMTAACFANDATALVPCAWLASYGLAVMSIRFVAGRAFSAMSATLFVAAALAALFPALDALWLALGFGGGHMVLAAWLWLTVKE